MGGKSRALRAAAFVTAGVAALTIAAPAPGRMAPVEHDGKVLSKESDGARSFRIADDETGRKLRFRVTDRTQFERIPGGFSGLERGMSVSVDGRRTDSGRLVARFVERNRNA